MGGSLWLALHAALGSRHVLKFKEFWSKIFQNSKGAFEKFYRGVRLFGASFSKKPSHIMMGVLVCSWLPLATALRRWCFGLLILPFDFFCSILLASFLLFQAIRMRILFDHLLGSYLLDCVHNLRGLRCSGTSLVFGVLRS